MAGVDRSDSTGVTATPAPPAAAAGARARRGPATPTGWSPVMRASGLAVVAVGLLAARPTRADDAFMYAASGRWILEHGFPRTDPFSWTAGGQPWQSNGWLFGVVASVAFRLGGWAGLAVLASVLLVVTGAAVWFAARALGADRDVAAVGALLATLLLSTFAEPRPHLASYLCFALALGCSVRAYGGGRLRPGWLVALAVVMVVWANLHGTALLGAAAVAAVVGGQAVREAVADDTAGARVRRLAGAGLVVVVAAGALLVNPYGLDLYRHAAEVRSVSRATITEWFPLWAVGWTSVVTVVFVVVAVAAVVLVVRRAGWRRPELLLLMAGTGLLAVDSNRIVAYVAISVVVSGAALIGSAPGLAARGHDPVVRVGGWTLLGAALVVTAVGLPALGAPSTDLPVAAVDALPAGCRLLNDRAVGGFVLLRRPDVVVAADGRNDLYGEAGNRLQQQWFEADSPGGDPTEVTRQGVTCVLALDQSRLVDAMVAQGWTLLPVAGPGRVAVAPGSPPPPPG